MEGRESAGKPDGMPEGMEACVGMTLRLGGLTIETCTLRKRKYICSDHPAPPTERNGQPWKPISTMPSGHPGAGARPTARCTKRSEEHTSELQSLMRISYAVFCLKKKNKTISTHTQTYTTLSK